MIKDFWTEEEIDNAENYAYAQKNDYEIPSK